MIVDVVIILGVLFWAAIAKGPGAMKTGVAIIGFGGTIAVPSFLCNDGLSKPLTLGFVIMGVGAAIWLLNRPKPAPAPAPRTRKAVPRRVTTKPANKTPPSEGA
jgi:hypothetical protein